MKITVEGIDIKETAFAPAEENVLHVIELFKKVHIDAMRYNEISSTSPLYAILSWDAWHGLPEWDGRLWPGKEAAMALTATDEGPTCILVWETHSPTRHTIRAVEAEDFHKTMQSELGIDFDVAEGHYPFEHNDD